VIRESESSRAVCHPNSSPAGWFLADATRSADICLFVSNEGETACGALLEAGAALAAGKRVIVVSLDWWSFAEHLSSRT
jgi:hypothetical protein